MKATRELNIHVHQEDDGSIWGEVVELPGCFASGSNLDEFREALAEAISLYLNDTPDGGEITKMGAPNWMAVEEMRVAVPA